jgi:hypothetical protein
MFISVLDSIFLMLFGCVEKESQYDALYYTEDDYDLVNKFNSHVHL